MIGKLTLVFIALFAFVAAAPQPGGWGKKHEHHVIHVPYHVHTVHHHHVEKVPIYKEVPVIKHVPIPIVKHVPVPVIKHVPVYKEIHVPVYREVHHQPIQQHGWEEQGGHGGWW